GLKKDSVSLPAMESARACKAVAEGLAAQGHPEHAVDQLLKAREYDPKIEVSASLARLYARIGKDKLALDEFSRAADVSPKDADLLNDFGYYHYQRGNWAAAQTSLQKAVAANPKHERGWINLGLTLGQQSKYPESLEAFEKVVRPAEARCNLAFVLMTQTKYDKARELYTEALRLDPGLTLARSAVARLNSNQPTKE
ncbi:MAG: tetratricopeptide repeat protein, partial [Gemmataceae bacterium]